VKPQKPRHITLMIMPETSEGEVRRLRFERKWLGVAGAALGLLLLMTAAGVLFGWSSVHRTEQHEAIAAENRALRDQILAFDARLGRAHDTIQRLEDYEQKLRALTMVSDPARNLAMGPVGPTERVAPRDTVQAAQLRKALLSASAVEETIELMSARVENLEVRGERVEDDIASLSVLLEGQKTRLSSTPSRRPSPGYVSSTYGMRVDPFTGLPQLHAGIDFAANIGAPVTATADGTVVVAGPFGAFGNTVQIDHGHGLTTVFAHMSRVDVRVGDEVRRGDRVGAVGNTGRSTGPHLHYEVRLNGIPQDPSRFILD